MLPGALLGTAQRAVVWVYTQSGVSVSRYVQPEFCTSSQALYWELRSALLCGCVFNLVCVSVVCVRRVVCALSSGCISMQRYWSSLRYSFLSWHLGNTPPRSTV